MGGGKGGGGKGGQKVKVAEYLLSIDYGICHGEIDSINQVYVKEKPIWCGYLTEPRPIYVNQPDIFGGETKEGGVVGVMECYFGTEDQVASGPLAQRVGKTPDTMPGYRGISHIFFRGVEAGESDLLPDPPKKDSQSIISKAFGDLLSFLGSPPSPNRKGFQWITNNPYLPPAWVNVTRLPKSLTDLYFRIFDPTSPGYNPASPYSYSFDLDPDEDPEQFLINGWPYYYAAGFNWTDYGPGREPGVFDPIAAGITAEQIDLGGVAASLTWDVATVGLIDGGAVCTLHIRCWDGIEANWEGDPDSPYKFLGKTIGGPEYNPDKLFHTPDDGGAPGDGAVSTILYPGTRLVTYGGSEVRWFPIFDALSPNNRQGAVSILPLSPVHCLADGTLGYLPDANPAHIIFECLTNTDWGMGAPSSTVNMADQRGGFVYAARMLFDEKFGLSMMWQQQSTIEDYVKEVLDHIQAALYLNPETGLWDLVLFRDDYDVDDLVVLDGSNSTFGNRQRKALGETINEVVVTWTNPQNEEEETITFQDIANIAMQGQVVSDTRNYYGVRNTRLAQIVGARDIRASSYPIFSTDAKVDRSVGLLKPGQVVKITIPDDGITNLVCRVLKAEYGRPGERTQNVALTEEIFSLGTATYEALPGTAWESSSTPPEPFDYTMVQDAPLPLLLRSGYTLNDVSDEDYPIVVEFVGASMDGFNPDSFELVGLRNKPNGEVYEGLLAVLEPTPTSVTPEDWPREAATVYQDAEFAGWTGRLDPDTGDFIQVGGAYPDGEIVMVDSYREYSEVAPIPDTPVWDTLETVPSTVNTQAGGAITITHTGDMDKAERTLPFDGSGDFDLVFHQKATMVNDSAATVGVFVGEATDDRRQIAFILFYTGSIYRQRWNGLTFVSEGARLLNWTTMPAVDKDIYWRLKKEGAKLTGYVSDNGADWTFLEVFPNVAVEIGDIGEIGVFTNSNGVTTGVQTKGVTVGLELAGPQPKKAEWTLARGMMDTVPQEWPAGTRMWYLGDNLVGKLDPTQQSAGVPNYYKMLPRATGGTLLAEDADPVTFTPGDRPYSPLRPANVRVDGELFQEVHYGGLTGIPIPADLTLSWSWRNRLSEDSIAPRWTDGSVTPEAGQVTKIEVRERFSQDLFVTYEITDPNQTELVVPADDLVDYRFYDLLFYSERDGIVSQQNMDGRLDLERLGYGNNYGYDYGENDGS